jgi:hypothetical protein
MKEIESLEEEFSGSDDTDTVEASSVMEELAEMEEERSIPVATKSQAEVLPFEKKSTPKASSTESKTSTSMSFKVQGDLNLELQFEVGGKTIMLEVSEGGLNIKMDGGISFNVPVSDAQSLKKAV